MQRWQQQQLRKSSRRVGRRFLGELQEQFGSTGLLLCWLLCQSLNPGPRLLPGSEKVGQHSGRSSAVVWAVDRR